MTPATECGFDPVIVFDWLDTHCTKREDGRYLTIGRHLLDDSHRDTLDRWRDAIAVDPAFVVPLGRWDEILMHYGVMLYEFELWASELYGWDAYLPGC
ncbi:MAG: hypothetical protein ACXVHB_05785 [Solirubrobacteraceae bacterium]